MRTLIAVLALAGMLLFSVADTTADTMQACLKAATTVEQQQDCCKANKGVRLPGGRSCAATRPSPTTAPASYFLVRSQTPSGGAEFGSARHSAMRASITLDGASSGLLERGLGRVPVAGAVAPCPSSEFS